MLFLGFAYKPNTPDTRNTKIVNVMELLYDKFHSLDCYDPLVDKYTVAKEYGIEIRSNVNLLKTKQYDLVVKAVEHNVFKNLDLKQFDFNRITIIDLPSLL